MDAAPLTRRQRATVVALSIATALTRWPALSRTLWDWDEALFLIALRDYDVTAYHPHPPGFPLFVAAAKLLPLDSFHALQAIAAIASCLVFPAAFFLARELRANAFVAIGSGLLLAFLPNVWFYGGTALSDVPSMVLSMLAAALLLRGRRSDAALIAGAVALGIAAGVRPQNLLIGAVPFALALYARRRTAMIGAVIIAAIVAISYGAAASLSGGWDVYRDTLARHAKYIRETDSFVAPLRPSLLRVSDDFFVRPFRMPAINIALTLLAAVAMLRRRPHALLALAIFGPFALFAWLSLDFHSASRFSIAYMPLVAILAAEGLEAIPRVRVAALAMLVALTIVWTAPALRVAHRTASPPVAAIDWIRAHLDPVTAIVYVDERVAPHAEALLPEYERRLAGVGPPAVGHEHAPVVLLREGASNAPGAVTFARGREPLASIARPRYFEASVLPARRIVFAEGWYGEEGPPRAPWRWMSRRSRAILPPFAGRARLLLRFIAPADAVIEVRVDGRLLERFETPRAMIERTWEIGPSRELTLATSSVADAPGDTRELGLRLESIELVP